MEVKKLHLEIIEEHDSLFILKISDSSTDTRITFDTQRRTMDYLDKDELSDFIRSNEYQIRSLLYNKRSDSYYKGFNLDFSIVDGKDMEAFNDRTNIIVKMDEDLFVVPDTEKSLITEVYTDASFDERLHEGAFCVLKKAVDGSYESKVGKCLGKDSNSVELEAVVKALEIFPEDIRIITDSQYVRKGITEWIIHWKLNDWHTANGTKAKNIDKWLYLEKLCEGRRIEFGYVKAHNNHFENEYCDMMARVKRESKKEE